MTAIEDFLETATAPGVGRLLPGCVVIAANKDGIAYSKCFGTRSVDPASPLLHVPLTLDTTMWIASCTKLMTAISVLQCVEKGLLNLDDDISTVLPEWKKREVLLGFDEAGKPILREANGKITVGMLLTHQSGMGYTFMLPALEQYAAYKKSEGQVVSELVRDKYLLPLSFDPGTSWSYGVGVDWAGVMVENVTNQTLESYMSEHIWKPLGMTSTTFRLRDRPDIKSRRADMSMRAPSGDIGPSPTRYFTDDAPDDHGGAGLFSSPEDYIKVLIAVLKNDGTLLKPATTDILFSPCLSPAATEALRENRAAGYQAYRSGKIGSEVVDIVEPPAEMNFAMGGQVCEQEWRGGRQAGSMSWGGLPNLSWFIDRKTGVALLYASQVIPPGDHVGRAAFERFERAVYSGELGNLAPSYLKEG